MITRAFILFGLLSLRFCLFSQDPVKFCDDGSVFDPSNYSSLKGGDPGISPMACASGSNLVTIYATNNAQRGHMFDITANNCVTIHCFEMNLSAGTSNISIYTKTGTHVGFESTSGAWTLIGTANNVASAGVNVPTTIPLNFNELIATGATRAFYITRTTALGPTVAYTNGTAVGTTLASDANIIIKEGTGKEYLFSTNYVPRRFNGRVFYTVNPPCVLPIELSKFSVEYSGESVHLNWETAMEKNNDFFVIERSKNGTDFAEVKKVKAVGNSTSLKDYSETDDKPYTGLSYYRLKQVDLDGQYTYSELRNINTRRKLAGLISIAPSPASDNINIEFNAEIGTVYDITISEISGKTVYSSSVVAEKEITTLKTQVENLEKGMYFVTLSCNNEANRVKFIKE